MQKYEEVRLKSRKQMMLDNFLGGLMWALGGTIGLSLFIAVIGLLTKQLHLVPFIGSFVSDITKFVMEKNPALGTH